MATRDTGGQQKATRTREETDEVEASVDTDVAERHKEMTDDVDSILGRDRRGPRVQRRGVREGLCTEGRGVITLRS